MMFKEVNFPLTYDQRFHIFRQILWNYSVGYLKPEDYKKIGKPKKAAAAFAGVWGLGFLGLQ